VIIGAIGIKSMLYGSFFGTAIIFNSEKHPEMELVRTSLLSKLMSFASSGTRRDMTR